MRKVLITIFTILMMLTVVSVAFAPVPAEAGIVDTICLFNPNNCVDGSFTMGGVINGTAAWFGNLLLTVSASILSMAGTVLNVSIVLTLNIKALYEATPAIDRVWIVIRNLSSMFIIFALLLTSILTILDVAKTSASTLIKNIIMAGILINFSLFFTKTLIDASNLISLQFYRALVPNSATLSKDSIYSVIDDTFSKGGISDVFMQSLKLPSIYNNQKGFITGVPEKDFLNITISTFGGSILILLAAGSFFAASIAFIIRIVILLLLMGFSPIYFVGMIFPQIKDSMSKKWEGLLIGQLVFMPIYLLLMYVAVSFLSGVDGTGFFSQLDKARATTGTSNNLLFSSVGLILQYTIAYILLIIPLMAAIKLGGDSAKLGQSAQKWVSGVLGGVVGRNTAGRLARATGSGFDSMAAKAQNIPGGKFASSVLRNFGVSQFTRGQLDKYEKSKYGSSQSLADVEKQDKDRARVVSSIARYQEKSKKFKDTLKLASPNHAQWEDLRKEASSMTSKEIEKLAENNFDILVDPKFAASLTSQQFDKIVDGDFITEQEKTKVKEARALMLNDMLESGQAGSATIAEYMKGLSGKELAKLKQFNSGTITNEVLDNLRPTQLKEMSDLKGPARTQIGNYISQNPRHTAHGYINQNRQEWS